MKINRTHENFQEYLKACSGKRSWPAEACSSQMLHKSSWAGGTFDGAMTLASSGWAEGRAKIEAFLDAINVHVNDRLIRQTTAYDVTGDCLDMGRYVTGEPECWMHFENNEMVAEGKSKRVIKIVVNTFISAGIDEQMFFIRGAAIAALVEALESNGHRVELVMAFAGAGDGASLHEVVTTIKEAHAPVQLDQLAYTLCHVSMFRRLQFSYLECEPKEIGVTFGACSYYYHGATPKESGDIVMDCLRYGDRQWSSVDTAKTWVLNQLRAQGVALSTDEEEED